MFSPWIFFLLSLSNSNVRFVLGSASDSDIPETLHIEQQELFLGDFEQLRMAPANDSDAEIDYSVMGVDMSYWGIFEEEDAEMPNYVKTLEEMRLMTATKVWGPVIVRCTYGSQEKWDQWLATFKALVRWQLEFLGADESLQSSLVWTVIEHADLDGADRFQAKKAFRNWISQSKKDELDVLPWGDNTPFPEYDRGNRYLFFVYVNDDSIESVADPERSLSGNKSYYWFVSVEDMVIWEERDAEIKTKLARGEDLGLDTSNNDKDDDDDMVDCWKKLSMRTFVQDYANFYDNRWYTCSTDSFGIQTTRVIF